MNKEFVLESPSIHYFGGVIFGGETFGGEIFGGERYLEERDFWRRETLDELKWCFSYFCSEAAFFERIR